MWKVYGFMEPSFSRHSGNIHCRRVQAVEWGHDEEVYNTRKDGRQGAYIYTKFVAELRIEIPNWDFDPRQPVEEIDLEMAA